MIFALIKLCSQLEDIYNLIISLTKKSDCDLILSKLDNIEKQINQLKQENKK